MKKQKKSLINNMTEGALTQQLLFFALPIMGANLLQALYTLVDLWAVGKFGDAAAISAVSISGQIVFLIHAVGIGLSSGGQVLISQQIGVRQFKQLSVTIGTLVAFTTLISSLVAVIGGIGAEFWIQLLRTPAAAQTGAVHYLIICCLGTPFMCISGSMCAVLRGVGESKQPMYILLVAAIANGIMDVIFVAMLGWGAAGAAIATSAAQVFSAAYALGYAYHCRDQLGFDFRPSSFRIEGKTLKIILKLGMPLVVMSASITVSLIVITAFVNAYGVAASAITGIGSKITSVVNAVTSAMQTACSSVVAQNFAAGKMQRVRKTNYICNLICMGFFLLVAVACLGFPVQIIGIFTTSSEVEVLALAREYMWIMCWMYLAFCAMSTSLGHINGVGFTSFNLAVSILDGVICRIGLSLLFGYVLNLGVASYWWGSAIAAYVSVFFGLGYFFFGHWETRKSLVSPLQTDLKTQCAAWLPSCSAYFAKNPDK